MRRPTTPNSPGDPARHRPETDVLLARWRDTGDRGARDELVDRFMVLARRLASRYRGPNEPFDDLVQVASVGLLASIDRFDPGRGVTFQTFAVPTILGELKRHFRATGWSVHVPRGAQDMALRVDRACQEITARSGRQPRVEELAEYLEVSAEEVMAGLDAGTAHYAESLDAPVASTEADEPRTLMDTVGHTDDGYAVAEMTASLAAAMKGLRARERQALSLRLERDISQTEIAAELGCSQIHVSRLLRRAAAHVMEMIDPAR
jgi:RNA polymerase sigma-B factor